MIFFKINGKEISSPKEIEYSYEILDKTERTISGIMVFDEIGKKKIINVTWDYLKQKDMKILKEELMKNGFTTISYRESTNGDLTTLTTRAGDFSYSPTYDWVNDSILWKNVSITFEER